MFSKIAAKLLNDIEQSNATQNMQEHNISKAYPPPLFLKAVFHCSGTSSIDFMISRIDFLDNELLSS